MPVDYSKGVVNEYRNKWDCVTRESWERHSKLGERGGRDW